MTRCAVEVGFGNTITDSSITWTDITQYVDIQSSGIRIDNRGSQTEQSETQPSTCSLVLDNSDGRFTSSRTGSPYYPNVRKNAPIRVSVVTVSKNFMPNPSFESGVSEWVSSGTPTRVTDATHVQDSATAMKVTWGAVASQTMTSPVIYGLDIGTRYTFSAYVWVPTGDAPVRLTVADVTTGAQSTLFDQFQRLTVSWTATSTSHQVRVGAIGTPAAGDVVWVDAAQIEAASSATAFDSNGAQVHPRFFGMVNDWPTKWTGLSSTVSITCTDVFKRLSRTPALRPMLIQEVLLDGPLAYYPMGETSDSTSAGDESGVLGSSSLTIQQKGSGGSLTFDSSGGPADTLNAPTFTPDDSANGKYLRATLGEAFTDASVTNFVMIECWFNTITRGRNILTVFTSDEGRYIIFYLAAATGFLTVETRNPTSGGAVTTTVGAVDLANGGVHHLVYDSETKEILIDGVSLGTFSAILTLVNLDTLHVGASQNGFQLWQGSVSHVALYATTSLTTATLATHYTTGLNNHTGETADLRVARLASYVGMTVLAQGSGFSQIVRQAGLGSSALDHMREVERTEAGRLISSRSSAQLVFQGRSLRSNPVPAFTVAYADLETREVELADDDQKMVNTLLLSRPTGSQTRIADKAAIAAYGPYEQTLELFTMTDEAMVDRGNWIVSRYADPPPELRTVPLEASTLGLTAYRQILDADVSSAFTVTSLPAEAPASSLTCTIEGYSETITQNQHKFGLFASRTDLDTRWVLNDSTYSVLGTTTRLGF
ncbi:carbohydrate binding domain-containing protein [Streptomyces sp. B21-083]|uniref:carbohydrate binding domain-containing protein n=1 Tax=Streptomyces sp. B21-083 TaxID=3039410 RepID=UPI002FF19463